MGSGNDILNINETASNVDGDVSDGRNIRESTVNMGEGHDSVNVADAISNSTINMETGNDNLTVGDDISNSSVNMGEGNDNVTIGDDLDSSEVNMGTGQDNINITEDMTESSINMGEGNDTVTIGDNVSNSSINMENGSNNLNVTNSISNSDIDMGLGNDTVTIGDDLDSSSLNTDGGKDTINIADDISESSVNTGAGDDNLTVSEDVSNSSINMDSGRDNLTIASAISSSVINMGEGDDNLSIGLSGLNSSINMGSGNDTIDINRIEQNTVINTDEGNDHVTINDVSSGFDAGSVNLGSGVDTLVINDSLEGTDAIFNGGNGIDNLILTQVTQEAWDNGLSNQFINFENITLGGDITPIEDIEEPEAEIIPAEDSNILVSENFEDGIAEGWSINTITESDGNATNFLGRFGGTNGEEGVSKLYDFGVESAGKAVTIEFDMYEIDTWDDENFNVFINNTEASSDTMSHFGRTWSKIATDEEDGGTELDAIGSSGQDYHTDESHHYSLDVTLDDNGQVQLGFGSTLNSGLYDESYGIDNVEISWNNTVDMTEIDLSDGDFDTIESNDENDTSSNDNDDGESHSGLLDGDDDLLFDGSEESNDGDSPETVSGVGEPLANPVADGSFVPDVDNLIEEITVQDVL